MGNRWIEVLDHGPEAVVMGRATKGLPLLSDHDTGSIIGRVEDIHVARDQVMRGAVRFSRSARGKDAAADFEDGIQPDVSVGYRVHEWRVDGEKDGVETIRATKWEPLEVSLVAVPADPTVGKQREAEPYCVRHLADGQVDIVAKPVAETRESQRGVGDGPPAGEPEPVITEPLRAVEGGTMGAENSAAAAVGAVGASGDQKELAGIARAFSMSDRLPDWIEKGLDREAALKDVQAIMATRAAPAAPVASGAAGPDISPKERRDFSVIRAIQAAVDGKWDRAGFEKEMTQEIERKTGKATSGFYMPTNSGIGTRATGQIDTKTSTQGQELVFIEPGSFIELLRNRSVLLRAGATFLPGMVGNAAFPRQTGAGTAYWTGEAPTADVTISNVTFEQLSLSPKTVMSRTQVSRQALHLSVIGLEQLIRQDLAAVHALAIDAAGINGGGSNEPTGILATSGVTTKALGTNGAVPTYANMIDLFSELAVVNAPEVYRAITTPGIAGKLMKTEQFATTNGMPVWQGTFEDGRLGLLGYQLLGSNQVPKNLTKGTSTTICHAIIAGNFQELFLAEWGSIEVIVDPFTLAGQGLIRLVTSQMVDVGLRHKASFHVIEDALVS